MRARAGRDAEGDEHGSDDRRAARGPRASGGGGDARDDGGQGHAQPTATSRSGRRARPPAGRELSERAQDEQRGAPGGGEGVHVHQRGSERRSTRYRASDATCATPKSAGLGHEEHARGHSSVSANATATLAVEWSARRASRRVRMPPEPGRADEPQQHAPPQPIERLDGADGQRPQRHGDLAVATAGREVEGAGCGGRVCAHHFHEMRTTSSGDARGRRRRPGAPRR